MNQLTKTSFLILLLSSTTTWADEPKSVLLQSVDRPQIEFAVKAAEEQILAPMKMPKLQENTVYAAAEETIRETFSEAKIRLNRDIQSELRQANQKHNIARVEAITQFQTDSEEHLAEFADNLRTNDALESLVVDVQEQLSQNSQDEAELQAAVSDAIKERFELKLNELFRKLISL